MSVLCLIMHDISCVNALKLLSDFFWLFLDKF